jgi:nitrogenase molybdenum-iron protein alpha chain
VLASYHGGALEEKYGVPFIREHFPYGIEGFESWYLQISDIVGKREEALAYIESQKQKYLPSIESAREQLKGKTAFIALGPGMAFELLKVLRDLGVNVVHTTAYHFDPILDGGTPDNSPIAVYSKTHDDLDISVGDAQSHEFYQLIKQYKPDFLISHAHGANVWAARQGVISVEYAAGHHCLYGYGGVAELGHKIVAELKNQNLIKHVKDRYRSPFTEKFEKGAAFAFLNASA